MVVNCAETLPPDLIQGREEPHIVGVEIRLLRWLRHKLNLLAPLLPRFVQLFFCASARERTRSIPMHGYPSRFQPQCFLLDDRQ